MFIQGQFKTDMFGLKLEKALMFQNFCSLKESCWLWGGGNHISVGLFEKQHLISWKQGFIKMYTVVTF